MGILKWIVIALTLGAGALLVSGCSDDKPPHYSLCADRCALEITCEGGDRTVCTRNCREDFEYLRERSSFCYDLEVDLLRCLTGLANCDLLNNYYEGDPWGSSLYPCKNYDNALVVNGCW